MLDRGLVMISDIRTNAGVDNISMFRKMATWQTPVDRVLTVMTAGNLGDT
jgi:putative proteasome-type protease